RHLWRRHQTTLFPYTTLFRSHKRKAFSRGTVGQLIDMRINCLTHRGEEHTHNVWNLVNCGKYTYIIAGRKKCQQCCSKSGKQGRDRKSTRLNSSHVSISYAVF